jgi:two-component system response regulator TctD
MRILFAEDDAILSKSVLAKIKKMGHAADLAMTGTEADHYLKVQEYDLVILDLNLPGMDGQTVLKNLRNKGKITPILILTAKDQVEDKISLLNLGADDYMTKPFDFSELEARCRALLRRSQGMANDIVIHGDLTVNRQACSVFVNQFPVSVTNTEYRLLDIFLSHIGQALSKEYLIEHLYNFDDAPNSSAIEIYVARLRKLLAGSKGFHLRTLRGLGYLLDKQE